MNTNITYRDGFWLMIGLIMGFMIAILWHWAGVFCINQSELSVNDITDLYNGGVGIEYPFTPPPATNVSINETPTLSAVKVSLYINGTIFG